MMELVFLLEEASAKVLLDSLLPRILDKNVRFRCIPFEGKQDLEKQLMRKIRGYKNAQARFVILRDQDSNPDCSAIKVNLLDLCQQSGKAERCVVRIACRELETFYLADLHAVEVALEITGLERQQSKRKFRSPDYLENPKSELKTLTKNMYKEVAGSRRIGLHLDPDNARSPSFRNLIAAIRRMEGELLEASA